MSAPSAPPLALYPLYQPQTQTNYTQSVSIPRQMDPTTATLKAMGLECFLTQLINEAHLPQLAVVNEEQRWLMAGKMGYLRDFLLNCKAADPTFIGNKKCFSHPGSKSSWQIAKLFKELHKTILEVKKRRGLGVAHIIDGQKIVYYFIEVRKAAIGKEKKSPSLGYVMELRKVAKSHWKEICYDEASYGTGEIFGEREKMLMRAMEAGQIMIEEALSPEYLEAERLEQVQNLKGLDEANAALSRANRNVANAYRQVYSPLNRLGQQAPTPTTQMVANPYYGIGGNYSAVAFRQPNGLIIS